MSEEGFIKNWKWLIQSLQVDLGQADKWRLESDSCMIFPHYSLFNNPNRLMMLIMMFICYTLDSFQKQMKSRQIVFRGNCAVFEDT